MKKTLVSGLVVLAFLGCTDKKKDEAEAGSSSSTKYFIYTANGGDDTVSVHEINPATGRLTAGTPIVINSGTGIPYWVTVNPNNNALYVTNYVEETISMLSINGTSGALASLGANLATGGAPTGIGIRPQGDFLFVVNGNPQTVFTYSINAATRALTYVTASVDTLIHLQTAEVSPAGNLLFLGSYSDTKFDVWTINTSTGAISDNSELALNVGGAVADIVFHPTLNVVYAVTAVGVRAYSYNTTTGVLTAIGGAVTTAGTPISMAVAPSGNFAYVASDVSNDVTVFSVSGTGALTSVSAIAAGSSPMMIRLLPTGAFAYVCNGSDDTMSVYSVNSSSGALTAVETVPLGGSPKTCKIATLAQ